LLLLLTENYSINWPIRKFFSFTSFLYNIFLYKIFNCKFIFVTKFYYIIERQNNLRETYRDSVEINQIIVNASGTSQSRSYISKALSVPPYHFELAEHSVSLTVGRGVYEQLGASDRVFFFRSPILPWSN